MNTHIPIPFDRIRSFCTKWGIVEFSLFGSVLRDDFRPDSDVDVLVAFEKSRSLDWEDWLAMEDELREIFGGRTVDLVERRCVTNPFRRYEILTTRHVLYAACRGEPCSCLDSEISNFKSSSSSSGALHPMNMMPARVNSALANPTLGEMVQAMADVYGRYNGGPEW